ncbi:MAG: hypothetical protein JNL74_23460, partial [Fibrobacteres bacterium]|nr:hypothetical protein [Fibrobacterota bacterium]
MNYTLILDETGKFNPDDLNFVGGVLFTNFSRSDIDIRVKKAAIDVWEKELQPANLHFCEMSPEDRLKCIPLVHKVCTESTTLVKSTGPIELFYHEQQAYQIHLETCIAGSLSDLDMTSADTIEVNVSTRRHEPIMGIFYSSDKEGYEKRFETGLKHLIHAITGVPKNNVNVRLVVNATSFVMAIADIAIGVMRKTPSELKECRFKQYDTRLRNFYMAFDLNVLLESGWRINPPDAYFTLLEYALTLNSKSARFQKTVNLLLANLNKIDKPQYWDTLSKSIEQKLNILMQGREIHSIHSFLEILKPLFTTRGPENNSGLAHIQRTILWNEVQLLAHGNHRAGKNKDEIEKIISSYRQYIKKHSALLYPNILDGIKNQIENDLIIVQKECFNWLNFADIENWLKDDVVGYSKLVSAGIESFPRLKERANRDDLLARLHGT